MPSSSYYRRQAKILFSLSLVTSDAGVAGRLANLARHYQILAELERAYGDAPLAQDTGQDTGQHMDQGADRGTDHGQSGSVDPAS
jgi:hypothetical protein